jgi:hypothetical protein
LIFYTDLSGHADDGEIEWEYVWQGNSRVPISSIPEPTTGALLLLGGCVLGRLFRWHKAQR